MQQETRQVFKVIKVRGMPLSTKPALNTGTGKSKNIWYYGRDQKQLFHAVYSKLDLKNNKVLVNGCWRNASRAFFVKSEALEFCKRQSNYWEVTAWHWATASSYRIAGRYLMHSKDFAKWVNRLNK